MADDWVRVPKPTEGGSSGEATWGDASVNWGDPNVTWGGTGGGSGGNPWVKISKPTS